MVNPSQIGKAESVNLQFGSFGISAWLSDTGGTSHTGSVDDLKVDGIETGSRNFSSCCSSPKMSDCASKEVLCINTATFVLLIYGSSVFYFYQYIS
jgi:hypothetical protein